MFAPAGDEVTQHAYPRVPSFQSVTLGYVCSPPSGMQSRLQTSKLVVRGYADIRLPKVYTRLASATMRASKRSNKHNLG